MSLIKCPECGHMISDKAIACPKCRTPMGQYVVCPDCGEYVPCDADSCPKCGCPLKEDEVTKSESKEQQNPDDVVVIYEHDSSNRKPLILLLAIIAVLACAAGAWFYFGGKDNSEVVAGGLCSDPTAYAETTAIEQTANEDIVGVEADTIVHITPEFVKIIRSYQDFGGYSEGLAWVESKSKLGFVNVKGEVVIPCQFDGVTHFSEGYAAVSKDGKWGYIDKQGNTFIPFEYDFAEPFSEGIAVVVKNMTRNDGMPYNYPRFTFYNSDGKVNERLTDLNLRGSEEGETGGIATDTSFRNGTICAAVGRGNADDIIEWVVVNKDGEFVEAEENNKSSKSTYPYEVFEVNRLYGIRDSMYNAVVPAKYSDIAHDSHWDGTTDHLVPRISNGVVYATLSDDKEYWDETHVEIHGFIDLDGNTTFTQSDFNKIVNSNNVME